MKSMAAIISGAAIAMTAITGCGDSSPTDNNNPGGSEKLIPFAVGNKWLYQTVVHDSAGRQTQSRLDSNVIKRDTMIQGERWFFFNDDDKTPVTNRTDGIYLWDRQNHNARPFLKQPGIVGSSFEIGSQRFVLTSTSAGVNVPAGFYSCYQLRLTDQNNPNLVGTISLAPGVGPVKIETINTKPDGSLKGSIRMELKSVTLK